MESTNQVNDAAVLKAANKRQRAFHRQAKQDAQAQSLIDQATGPRRAKLAAMDKDWDEIINQRAGRRSKRRGDSSAPKDRKKARLCDDDEDDEEEREITVPKSSSSTKLPRIQLKTHKPVVDSASASASEYEGSDCSKSSAASEDDEEVSDDDLAKLKASGASEKEYRDLFNKEVKIIRAGDLFNSDDNVVSARSSSGPSKGSSSASGPPTSEADMRNDKEHVPSRQSQEHTKKYSKREEVFTKERARIVVTEESVPTKSRPASRQPRTATRAPKPLSYTSNGEDFGPIIKNHKDRLASDAELQWPTGIRILYNDGIKIRQQKPAIKTIIAETIQRCEVHMITEDAFPETGRREGFRYAMAKEALKSLRTTMGAGTDYEEAYRRARKDPVFVHKIGELAVDRLAHHRSEIRAAATTHIAIYQLGVGQVCEQRVAALLKGNLFVYQGHWASDGDQGWVIESRTAYLNLTIVHTIKDAWFSSERALGNQHQDAYISSLSGLPCDPKEFTIPLVALAATSVHAALSNWKTGFSRVKAQPFKGELVAATYNMFMTSLKNFKARKPLDFHRVMASLYTAVCGAHAETLKPGIGDDPLAVFDLHIVGL